MFLVFMRVLGQEYENMMHNYDAIVNTPKYFKGSKSLLEHISNVIILQECMHSRLNDTDKG
jgi:hypothetical protein